MTAKDETRTAITNARVFNGASLNDPGTVVFERGRILAGSDTTGAHVVDAEGAILIPGLIDAHVHVENVDHLRACRAHGLTTVLDMACLPECAATLRGLAGETDVRSAGVPAITPGSPHSHLPGIGERGLIDGHGLAAEFVAARLAEGSDFIKLILVLPGPSHDRATLAALATEARSHGLLSIAHAANLASTLMAIDAGVDILTHVPIDYAITAEAAGRLAAEGRAVVPTLTMMGPIVERWPEPGLDYDNARASVAALRAAGVPILAGTDANDIPASPAPVPHGASLHRELELLVDAGLSPAEALDSATRLPAVHFGMLDRGVIKPGYRADLVLLDGDPLLDIRASTTIRSVWCNGIEAKQQVRVAV